MPAEEVHRAPGKGAPAPHDTCKSGPGLREQIYTGQGGAEPADWLRQRRALRWNLDHFGDLDGWLHRKPILNDLEHRVIEQRRTSRVNLTKTYLLPDMIKRRVQSEEASQHTDDIGSKTHPHASTLSEPTGRAVENFRNQTLREYLQSVEQCKKHNQPISQPTLQRALLHPRDVNVYEMLVLKQKGSSSLLRCGGQVRGCSNLQQEGKKEGFYDEEKSTPQKVSKKMSRRQPLSRRADPNAFWTNHDSHVRLCLPVRSNCPENVLFQFITHHPASNPGHWPVNQAGYFTSGDISKNKSYIL